MSSLRDEMNREAESYGAGNSGGDFFKFEKTGNYKLRVLNKPVAIATHFFGAGMPSAVCIGMDKGCNYHGENAPKDPKGNEKKPSLKFMTYVINRDNGKIMLAELPYAVVSRIADFQEDEDFVFTEYPMPFDIKVKFDKENSDPKSIYKTEASPKAEEVTEEETQELALAMAKITPEVYVQKRKEKQAIKNGPYIPSKDFNKDTSKVEETPTIEYPESETDSDIPF